MFVQGQLCFFCDRTIPQSEASLEHLVPASLGGSDHPENLVACCRTLNALFGNMSIKEKVRAILKQNGKFICPNQISQAGSGQPKNPPPGKLAHKLEPLLPSAGRTKNPPPVKPALVFGTPDTPAHQGKPWSAEEDERLTAGFDGLVSVPDLAKAHQRDIGGIQSRLTKLGRLTPDQHKTYPSAGKDGAH